MRYLVTFIVLWFVNPVYSQNEVLFKVITWSDGVNIGGSIPAVGMNVSDPKLRIDIPQSGYLGVILNTGKVWEIQQSGEAASVIIPGIRNSLGSLIREDPDLSFFPKTYVKGENLIGDSLFINWKLNPYKRYNIEDTAHVVFSNIFDETLFQFSTQANYVVLTADQISKDEDAYVVEIRYRLKPQPNSIPEASVVEKKGKRKNQGPFKQQVFIKSTQAFVLTSPPETMKRVNFDLARLPKNQDRLFLEAALFTLDRVHYESHMCLYRIIKNNKTTSDPILEAFYKRALEENNLQDIKLD